MQSSRPYLLRALFEWIVDNGSTPYIVIDSKVKGTVVPEQLVSENGTIVFNISPDAVGRLNISNESLEFDASFSGVIRQIYAPISAVMAIYAQENGAGMMFAEEGVPGEEGIELEAKPKANKKPKLRVIKSDKTDS